MYIMHFICRVMVMSIVVFLNVSLKLAPENVFIFFVLFILGGFIYDFIP